MLTVAPSAVKTDVGHVTHRGGHERQAGNRLSLLCLLPAAAFSCLSACFSAWL